MSSSQSALRGGSPHTDTVHIHAGDPRPTRGTAAVLDSILADREAESFDQHGPTRGAHGMFIALPWDVSLVHVLKPCAKET